MERRLTQGENMQHRQPSILTGHDGGLLSEPDPVEAARKACEILLAAADEALEIIGLPPADRGRLLRIRRAYAAGAQRPHLLPLAEPVAR